MVNCLKEPISTTENLEFKHSNISKYPVHLACGFNRIRTHPQMGPATYICTIKDDRTIFNHLILRHCSRQCGHSFFFKKCRGFYNQVPQGSFNDGFHIVNPLSVSPHEVGLYTTKNGISLVMMPENLRFKFQAQVHSAYLKPIHIYGIIKIKK